MRNKKQTSSTLLICAAIFLVFAFVYLVTPPIYNKVLTKKYETREKELLEALTTDSDTEMLITRYAIENNAYLQIQGEGIQYATPTISSIGNIETNHSYQSYNGKAMNLTIQYANNSVVDLNRVQMVVLPVSALILICLVCLLQFLYKDSPQGDYDKLYKATSDMLSLSDQAYLPIKSGNKKQDALYKNINTLYEQIRMSIDALKRQVDDKSVMENHLLQLLKQQGGDTSIINDYQKLPLSSHKVYFYAPSDGYVQAMDTAAIGRASQETGAGRKQKTDVIDFGAGIVLKKRIGDSVTKGVVIAEIYSSTEKQGQNALSIIENAFEIGKNKISVPPLILDVIQ